MTNLVNLRQITGQDAPGITVDLEVQHELKVERAVGSVNAQWSCPILLSRLIEGEGFTLGENVERAIYGLTCSYIIVFSVNTSARFGAHVSHPISGFKLLAVLAAIDIKLIAKRFDDGSNEVVGHCMDALTLLVMLPFRSDHGSYMLLCVSSTFGYFTNADTSNYSSLAPKQGKETLSEFKSEVFNFLSRYSLRILTERLYRVDRETPQYGAYCA